MSLRFPGLNSPPLVAAAGAAILLGLPATLELSTVPLAWCKGANLLAFVTNVAAVSAPGRLDGPQDQAMRAGDLNPSKPGAATTTTPLVNKKPQQQENLYSPIRTRSTHNMGQVRITRNIQS